MAYVMTNYANGTTPPINADNLNHSERGIYNANASIEDTTGNVLIELVASRVVNLNTSQITMSNGVPQYTSTSSSYACGMIQCSAGDKFTVSGQGGGNARLWGFVDSLGNVLTVAESSASATNRVLTAPADSAWLIVHTNNGKLSYKNTLIRTELTNRLALVGYFGNSTQAGTYNNLNNLPCSSIATYGYSGMTNAPTISFTGTVITMGGRNNGDGGYDYSPQFAIDRYGNAYVRGRYSSYTEWTKLAKDSEVQNLTKLLVVSSVVIDTSTNRADGYFSKKGNLNAGTSGDSFYTPTAILLHAGECAKVNALGYLGNMSIITSGSSGNGTPLAISSSGVTDYSYTATSDVYVRFCCLNSYASSFTVEVVGSEIINDILNLIDKNNKSNIATFRKYGVVGDSLASGECVHNEGGEKVFTDFYDFSWVQFIGRKTGNLAINFSKGGFTTRSWLENSTYGLAKLLNPDNKCDCYFIALGENDANTLGIDYLGSVEDIDTEDPTQSSDSFYGNYAKIIGYIKQVQPKAIIFCITRPNPSAEELTEQFNAAIKDVAELFSCCLIELNTDDYSRTLSNRRWGHYNAWGYNLWSDIIIEKANAYMRENPEAFRQIEFIGTNYSWNP